MFKVKVLAGGLLRGLQAAPCCRSQLLMAARVLAWGAVAPSLLCRLLLCLCSSVGEDTS